MTDQTNYSRTALFRFAVISQVLAGIHSGEGLAQTIRAVATREQLFFDGTPQRVSRRSIYRWVAAYRARGIAGLEPKPRSNSQRPDSLPRNFVDFLSSEKQSDPAASIPEVIRRAIEVGILECDHHVDRTTVYRTAKRLGLPFARGGRSKERDTRRFAFPHRMDMVLCDGKHFRAGERRQKRVVLFYLDDATRLVLHAVVGTSETARLFQLGLYQCICKHGYMSAIYLDRGPGFVAEDTFSVLAKLRIPLIHGEAGYKEGRGKVERFNRTVTADVLRGLDGRADVDPACGALELRLVHYAEQIYAQQPHESLGGDSPQQRFSSDPRPLRWPENHQSLRAMFEICINRRVSNDHVVSIDAIDYEMPRGYRGQNVTLLRRLLDGTIGFVHEGKQINLLPVNHAANARAPRAKDQNDDEPQSVPPNTAADISFQRAFAPIVDADGGFTDPGPDDQNPKEIDP